MKRYIKNLNERTTIDDFVLNMKNAFRFYVASNHQDEREQIYQRDVRNIERRLLIQSSIDQQQQQSRSQYIDHQYQQRNDQSQYQQQQYIDQQQRISYNNNQSNRECRSQSAVQESLLQSLIFNQKLLINQMNHIYFVSKNQQQYQNNSDYDDVENDFMKFNNNVNNDIKYDIVVHVNFDEIEQIFNVEIKSIEQFNDESYSQHDMISMLCNICKINYINHDDLSYLNNHMFDIHSVKIRSQQFINRKRYIN